MDNNQDEFNRRSSRPPTVFSPELVEFAARVGHETVLAYCAETGYDSPARWEDASDFLKEKARRLVHLAAAGESAPGMHQAWADMMMLAGWCYAQGPVNSIEKTHPRLVPWERVPPMHQARMEIFRAAVRGALERVDTPDR